MKHARPDYQRIQDPARLIPEDEPVFLLRGQDPFAPRTLRYYADELRSASPSYKIEVRHDLLNLVHNVDTHADSMDEWQRDHVTHLPNLAPVAVSVLDAMKAGANQAALPEGITMPAMPALRSHQLDPNNSRDLEEMFNYHAPDAEQIVNITELRRAAFNFAKVLMLRAPHCADRTAALRKIREALMTANAAVALKGGV